VLFETQDRLLDLPGRYAYLRCQSCELVYLHPRPDWERRVAHYAPAYRGYHRLETEPSHLQQRGMRFGLAKRYRLVTAHMQSGRLLDAGCGGGDFLAYVREQGNRQVVGLERTGSMAHAARSFYNLDVVVGDIAQLGFAPGSFDVLTLWTVLEHLPDPRQALASCGSLLCPGGLLVVRTVNIDSWGARLFGSCWVGFDAPRVLSVFSRGTLRKILEQTGFVVITVGSYFHDFHPFLWSLDNLCRERLGEDRAACRLIVRLAGSWASRLLSYPYFALQTCLGKNGFMTALARKR
jgi:2-polyprenyl-3-methyl-5-hydroxy-6-metoxy-1,4-benzoquinol methylase